MRLLSALIDDYGADESDWREVFPQSFASVYNEAGEIEDEDPYNEDEDETINDPLVWFSS